MRSCVDDSKRCQRLLGEIVAMTRVFLAEVESGDWSRLDEVERKRGLRFAVLERLTVDPQHPELGPLLREAKNLDERLIPLLQMHSQKLKAEIARHKRLALALHKMRSTGDSSWPR